MHIIKSGEKLPILGVFTDDWEPTVVSDTPTVTVERKNLTLGVWETVVDGENCTKYADGRVDYSYTTATGNYQYLVKIVTTDDSVDQNEIVQELFSGGWVDDVMTGDQFAITKSHLTLIQEDLAVVYGEALGDVYKGESLEISATISKSGVTSITNDTIQMRWFDEAGEAQVDENADVSGGSCGFEFALSSSDLDLTPGKYKVLIEWASTADYNDLSKVLLDQKITVKART